MEISPRWNPEPEALEGVSTMVLLGVSAAVLAMLVGFWSSARDTLDTAARDAAADELEGRLVHTTTVLRTWAEREEAAVDTFAQDRRVIALAGQLLQREGSELVGAPEQAELREILRPVLVTHGYLGYFVVRPDGTSVASSRDVNVGLPNLVFQAQPEVFGRWLGGHTVLSASQASDVPLPGGPPTAPTLFSGAPLRDAGGDVVGVFMFRLNVVETVLPVLEEGGRWGGTGETLAFDRRGRLLNRSRYHEELLEQGEIGPDWFLRRRLVEPPQAEGALTHGASMAVRGRSGLDLLGHPNHRGTSVIAAWAWLPDLNIGVSVERAAAESVALHPGLTRLVDGLVLLCLGLVAGLTGLLLWARHRAVRTSKRLESARQELASIVDESADALIVVGADRRVQLANTAVLALFGVPASDALDHPIEVLLPDVSEVPGDGGTLVELRRTGASTFPALVQGRHVQLSDGNALTVFSVRNRAPEIRDCSSSAATRSWSSSLRWRPTTCRRRCGASTGSPPSCSRSSARHRRKRWRARWPSSRPPPHRCAIW